MSDEKVVVAVDAMGGDDAPGVVLDGVAQALASDPALEIVLCGPADVVEPFAAAHERCTPQACSEVIAMAADVGQGSGMAITRSCMPPHLCLVTLACSRLRSRWNRTWSLCFATSVPPT